MLTRVAELAKELASPVYVGQLDLRQALDKIKHSAVIDALREKQVPAQLIVVLVAWWSQSEIVCAITECFFSPSDPCAAWCASRCA